MRKAWIGVGYAFVALVVYLSLTPSPIVAPSVDGVKTGHVLAYLWLTLWFAQAYARWRTRMLFSAAFILMGVGLEYLQGMTSYRHFAYADMLDNALGVGFGVVLAATRLGRVFPEIVRA